MIKRYTEEVFAPLSKQNMSNKYDLLSANLHKHRQLENSPSDGKPTVAHNGCIFGINFNFSQFDGS